MKNIIKTAALTLSMGAILMCTGYSAKSEPPKTKSEPLTYTSYGRYDTNISMNGRTFKGFITNDGMAWEYDTDTVSNKSVYDGMPVWIGFSDNGTPDDITDDVPLGLVYDRETAIYDELEDALSDSFELERTNNNIYIKGINK